MEMILTPGLTSDRCPATSCLFTKKLSTVPPGGGRSNLRRYFRSRGTPVGCVSRETIVTTENRCRVSRGTRKEACVQPKIRMRTSSEKKERLDERPRSTAAVVTLTVLLSSRYHHMVALIGSRPRSLGYLRPRSPPFSRGLGRGARATKENPLRIERRKRKRSGTREGCISPGIRDDFIRASRNTRRGHFRPIEERDRTEISLLFASDGIGFGHSFRPFAERKSRWNVWHFRVPRGIGFCDERATLSSMKNLFYSLEMQDGQRVLQHLLED